MSFDVVGAKIRYDAAVRRSYRSVDFTKSKRIARQLINGNHVDIYGLESAHAVIQRNAAQVERAVIVRPSAKLVKHQKASCTVVNAQTKVRNAIDSFISAANELHKLRRTIEYVPTTRRERRNRRAALYQAGM